MSNGKIFIEREPIMIKEKAYMAYYIKGKIRGKDVKISIVPPMDGDKKDMGGYTVFDIVFGDSNKAELVIQPFSFTDNTGKTVEGAKYLAQNVDAETGEVFECNIKPQRNSDKALLNMLLKKGA